MKQGKSTPLLILVGLTTIGCTPLTETRLDPVLGDAPRDLLGSVRSDPCNYFFREVFERIDSGGYWSAAYARTEWIQQEGLERINSFHSSINFEGRSGSRFIDGVMSYTSSIGPESNNVIIRRSGSISENDSLTGSGLDLVDLQCKVVGETGWLVQGFYVDPENSFDTEFKYQWASSFTFVPGRLN